MYEIVRRMKNDYIILNAVRFSKYTVRTVFYVKDNKKYLCTWNMICIRLGIVGNPNGSTHLKIFLSISGTIDVIKKNRKKHTLYLVIISFRMVLDVDYYDASS